MSRLQLEQLQGFSEYAVELDHECEDVWLDLGLFRGPGRRGIAFRHSSLLILGVAEQY